MFLVYIFFFFFFFKLLFLFFFYFCFFFFFFFFFCSYGHLIIYLFATQSVGFIIFCCFVQCVVDVVVSDEELGHDVVKEAFEEFGIAYTLISSFILRRRLP